MLKFQYDCINPKSLQELEYIIDNGEEVSIEEFKANVNTYDFNYLAGSLGYSTSFLIEEDLYIEYNKSMKMDGALVYYMVHSAIEYVFYK